MGTMSRRWRGSATTAYTVTRTRSRRWRGAPEFDSPQAPADPKKVAAFFGKVKKRPYCCGCCGAPALPKNFPGRVWLKWIGEDKIFEDLPPRPPTYLVEKGRCYDCCSCFNCCCFLRSF